MQDAAKTRGVARDVAHTRECRDDGEEDPAQDGIEATGLGTRIGANTDAVQQLIATVQEYDLREWDPSTLPVDFQMQVFGKRRYGKSFFARDIVSRLASRFMEVYVFTDTAFNMFYQSFVPETRIYNSVDMDVLRLIIEQQRQHRREQRRQGPAYNKWPYILIIFDDVAAEADVLKYNQEFQALAFYGRHYQISTMFLLQDIKATPPGFRQNSDIIALTYQTAERAFDTIEKEFGMLFPNQLVLRLVMKRYTENYGLVVIDQTRAKYTPEDVFFWYRAAPECPPFRVGTYDFWKASGCDFHKQVVEVARMPVLSLESHVDWLTRYWEEDEKKWRADWAQHGGDETFHRLYDERDTEKVYSEQKRGEQTGPLSVRQLLTTPALQLNTPLTAAQRTAWVQEQNRWRWEKGDWSQRPLIASGEAFSDAYRAPQSGHPQRRFAAHSTTKL